MRRRSALLGAMLLTSACSSDRVAYVPVTISPTNVLTVDIVTGALLTADAGKGLGVFVEYAAGGKWHVFATCDTLVSKYTCSWDLVASVRAGQALTVTDQSELEPTDRVLDVDKGAVRLLFDTDKDTDGVRLSAPVGEPLELDVFWGSVHDDGTLVNWVGPTTSPDAGTVKQGAPSNPVDFAPTVP